MGIPETDPLSQLSLPPGFRFYPTDEELLVQYLCKKVAGHHFNLQIIGDIDLYKFDPWDLPSKAIFGEKEWYFFSPRDRKYPNGSRPNRVAGSGYWKATGTDKVITSEGRKVGIKKALVFYVGKALKGTKTNWIMHEYRLSDSPKKHGTSRLDDWVLCRIYKKTSSAERANAVNGGPSRSKEYSLGSSSSSSSQYDDVMESLTDFDGRFFSLPKKNNSSFHDQLDEHKINLQQLGSGNFDWATLAGLNPLPDLVQAQQGPLQNQQLMNMSGRNDVYSPGFPINGNNNNMDEEVQSGQRAQWFDQSRSIYSNPIDPFRFRYPTQVGGLGFRHEMKREK